MAAKTLSRSVFLSDSEGANATEEESKDPENASFAMQFQGVLLNSVIQITRTGKIKGLRFKNPAPEARKSLAHPEASECEAGRVGYCKETKRAPAGRHVSNKLRLLLRNNLREIRDAGKFIH